MIEILTQILNFFTRFDTVLLISLMVFALHLKYRSLGRVYLFIVGVAIYLTIPTVYRYAVGEEFWIYRGFYINSWYTAIYIIYWIFAMLLLYIAFRTKITDVLFYGAAAYTVQNFSHNIRALIRTTMLGGRRDFQSSLLLFLVMAAICVAYYFIFVRRLGLMSESRIQNGFLVAFVIGVLFVANVFSSYWMANTQLGDYDRVDVYGSAYAALSSLLLLFVQFGIFEQSKFKQDRIIMDEILSNNQKQQQISRENIDLINRKCHDLRHQISTVRAALSEEERERCFGEIEQAILVYDSIVKTGNEALDTVLTEKCLFCEGNGIHFSYVADGAGLNFMDKLDIYSLFGNALDNAIESVMKCPESEKRIITMRTASQGSALQIEIENYCAQPLAFEDGLPVTTKSDRGYHGYGVKSIRYIAEKYKGTVFMKQQGNRFILRILFAD